VVFGTAETVSGSIAPPATGDTVGAAMIFRP
jgi:hypothetical protein